MNSAENYENFLKSLQTLIKEGAIKTKLQLVMHLLNYSAVCLAKLNEPMDEPIEGKTDKPPQQNKTEWNEHYGGKIYQNSMCEVVEVKDDDNRENLPIVAPL